MKGVASKPSARRRRSVPVFFWHCTPVSRLPGILGRGLVPGGKGWVYLSDCRDTAANYVGMFHPERAVVLRIAGAALDCFVGEPLTAPPPWAALDNVLLAPHSIAWTDELFRDIGRTAWQGMIDLSHGKKPAATVNPEVFERPTFQKKWQRVLASIKME